MRILKRVLIALLVILVVIQFFKPEKNIAAGPFPNDISTVYAVPANVQTILNKACNDCHSNNTKYPWYNNIQPVAWWLHNHIKDGKRGLNFNEFASYRLGRQYRKMDQVIKEVKEDEMPLGSYTIIHTDAKLTNEEKTALVSWAKSIRDTMEVRYPKDSLVIKKVVKG
jgi:hypothetical protein